MADTKDRAGVMASLGIVLPAVFTVLAVFNVVTGSVILYDDHRSQFAVLTGFWYVVGAVLAKLGFAGALASWFLLANLRAIERTAQLWLLVSIGIAATGLLALLAHAIA